MKKTILLISFILMAIYGFGQGYSYPINYQAVVRNGVGDLVPDGGVVNFRFTITEASAAGAVLYSETQSAVVHNNQGLVSLAIGDGIATVGGALGAANFREQMPKYLKVEVDATGGSSFIDLGSTQLKGVPYANHAYSSTEARNGYYKVFEHTTTSANTVSGSHITTLNYDAAAATDILIVTHRYNSVHLPRVPYSVFWTGSNWTIYLDKQSGSETMPLDTKFNVMVIKTP